MRGPDVHERGVLEARLGPAARVVVGAPEVSRAAPLLEEDFLGIRVELAADGHHATAHVDDQLDHVAEVESDAAGQFRALDRSVCDEDPWTLVGHRAHGGRRVGGAFGITSQRTR